MAIILLINCMLKALIMKLSLTTEQTAFQMVKSGFQKYQFTIVLWCKSLYFMTIVASYKNTGIWNLMASVAKAIAQPPLM